MTTKRIFTVTFSACIAILAVLLAYFFDTASAQSPPIDMSQLDPNTIALINAMQKTSDNSGDLTSTGVNGMFVMIVGGFLTWIMRNGGFVVTWRMHEEDRGIIKEATTAMKEAAGNKDILIEIKTKVESHGQEIHSLRDLKHDLPNKLTPIVAAMARIEGILEEREDRRKG